MARWETPKAQKSKRGQSSETTNCQILSGTLKSNLSERWKTSHACCCGLHVPRGYLPKNITTFGVASKVVHRSALYFHTRCSYQQKLPSDLEIGTGSPILLNEFLYESDCIFAAPWNRIDTQPFWVQMLQNLFHFRLAKLSKQYERFFFLYLNKCRH